MASDWKSVSLPKGSKLLKAHSFTLMIGGDTYDLEVDEYADGTYAGHGEHATDESSMVASVTGTSIEGCLQSLVDNIQK